ncbi:MAG: D-hydantoinase/dihydropyrimidinase [Gemmatimonadota bacterium]|nr:MAG: D-hydantoinase/dihydropyrimidinase [Gemmatimonadota bacterium]
MGVLIRNGTVVTSLDLFRGDVLCEGGRIAAVGPQLDASGHDVVDASGQYVFPGGVDPHVHMALPFMGNVSLDDYETGGAAGVAGGTTTFIDFCIPGRDDNALDVLAAWHEKARIATVDYTYHMAVTSWGEQSREWMRKCVEEEGLTSIKVFMAYRGAIGIDDTELIHAMRAAAELGAVVTVHAEHGEMVVELQNSLFAQGKVAPKYHAQSRPSQVEGEATNRALMIAETTGATAYIVHMTCQESVTALARARERGQLAYGETCPQYLLLDDMVYEKANFEGSAYVMSPPIRPRKHQEALWGALQSGILQTVGTDHITFSHEQKLSGKDDFRIIPNGAGGIQDRMSLLWNHGVRTGRLNIHQFVDLTSTRAARIFDLYPRKGSITVGADADLVVWDPAGTRTISAKTHHHQNDRSIFEGFEVTGVPSTVLVQGRVAYANGDLKVERGSGRFLARKVTRREIP